MSVKFILERLTWTSLMKKFSLKFNTRLFKPQETEKTTILIDNVHSTQNLILKSKNVKQIELMIYP